MLSKPLRYAFVQLSHVGPALWGVRVTLGSENSGWFGAGGSSTMTSRPAPAIVFAVSARHSASSSTTGPRHVLTRTAVGFIIANSRVDIILRVTSLSGTWRVTTSEVRSSSGKGA